MSDQDSGTPTPWPPPGGRSEPIDGPPDPGPTGGEGRSGAGEAASGTGEPDVRAGAGAGAPHGSAGVQPPPPAGGGTAAGGGAGSGGGKGCFGCLGCAGIVVVLLVGIPLVLAGVTWFFLPTIVAPADTEWVMVAPDAERGQEVREAVQSQFVGMSPGERTTLRLEEADLNQLLANAISEGLRTEPEATEAAPQGRFRIDDGVLYLDVRVTIPEGTTGIPARLQGEPTGMQLGLAPRAAGNAVSMRVREVRLGRVPIPVGVAMSLLARTRAADGLPFLDPDTGELRVSLQQLGPMAEGVTLHDLSVGDGALRLDVSR